MSDAPKNLDDIYEHELQDLWSANDQMLRVVKQMADIATDETLRDRLVKSQDGIQKHTDLLKSLLEDLGAEVKKEHCKGMEGLCKEAVKHAIEEDIEDGAVRDVIIAAQYQRMTHYGICGFGTAKAYAEALGEEEHVEQLDEATAEIYGGDENMTQLAEMSLNLAAADADEVDEEELDEDEDKDGDDE